MPQDSNRSAPVAGPDILPEPVVRGMIQANRFDAVLAFLRALGRPVRLRRRHNGFDVLGPDDAPRAFVRRNIRGRFTLHVRTPARDPENRFAPLPGRTDHLTWQFPGDDPAAGAYALRVLRSVLE